MVVDVLNAANLGAPSPFAASCFVISPLAASGRSVCCSDRQQLGPGRGAIDDMGVRTGAEFLEGLRKQPRAAPPVDGERLNDRFTGRTLKTLRGGCVARPGRSIDHASAYRRRLSVRSQAPDTGEPVEPQPHAWLAVPRDRLRWLSLTDHATSTT